MTDIVESLCKATNILVEKQLESLSFDITIEATVTDATNADDGRYIVSDGSALFEAYSSAETNYNKNDVVLVTIPQGDYNKQKIIIGKQANNTESAKTYISPFEEFINVSNNLISGEHYISMQANGGINYKYTWDINTLNFSDSTAFQKIRELTNKKNNSEITEEEFLERLTTETCLVWNSETDYQGKLFESKYTKLGMKMQVSTWLNEYDVIEGNFGLMIVLMVQSNDGKQSFPVFIPFDSKDFFGNVYNFETYYNQEILVDISEYINYPINQILIFAYQRNNFKDINGDLISSNENETGFFGSSLPENIFIKDLYLCLGKSKGEFEQDSLEIITSSSAEYSSKLEDFSDIEYPLELENASMQLKRLYNNQKVLGLRWIHKDPETNEIKRIVPNEIPPGYQIYWYRYKLGAPSPDNFAGPHWERFYGAKNINVENFLLNDEEEYNLTRQEVYSTEANHAEDIATNMLDNVIFYPNINKQTEQIKAIVVKEEKTLEGFSDSTEENTFHFICSSEIEEFRNKKEVTNITTFIDVNALNIKFNDSEKGNYFLYNRAGNISTEKDKELKTLTAVFDNSGESDIYDKSELMTPYSYIKWSFPASSSMIIPATSKNENAVKLTKENLDTASSEYNANVSYNFDNDTYDFIFLRGNESTAQEQQVSLLTSVGYFISSRLDRNATRNIINLEVMKDGQLYTASVKMNFGTAGTSGSDYTLAIVWDNNENAFDINKGELCGQVCLYNQNGELVELEDESEYSIDWYKVRALNAELYDETKEYKIDDIVSFGGNYYKCKISNNIGNLPTDENYWQSTTNIQREFSPKIETRNLYYPINSDVIEYLKVSNSEETTKIFKTSYTDTIGTEELQNNIVSYLASPPRNGKTYEIAYFDAIKKEFIKEYEEDGNKKNITYNKDYLQYRKLIDNEKTGILTFKAFDEVDTSGASPGYIEYKDKKMIYYYSSLNRAFVKYNDMYIIDPWDEYNSTETYYYPVYDSKKNYISEKNLQIVPVSEDSIPISKGRFKIKKDKHSIVHIETDLYILEVTLTHFGDYDLIARFPIPLKNSDINYYNSENNDKFQSYIVDYIEGPTDVRYSTSGENDYNKNPYQITLRYLSKHPITVYREATDKYKKEMNDILTQDEYVTTEHPSDDCMKKFKDKIIQAKIDYQSAIYSTQYINNLYTKTLEDIEKSRYEHFMSSHLNLETNFHINTEEDIKQILGEQAHNYLTTIDEYQNLYLEDLAKNLLNDDNSKILKKEDNLKDSNDKLDISMLKPEDIDKNIFITYQQKKQGYNETKNNANEIIGHWELVYESSEKTNDFTFLVESNEINIIDVVNSQLYGIKDNQDGTYQIFSETIQPTQEDGLDPVTTNPNYENPYYPGSLYWMQKKFDSLEAFFLNEASSVNKMETVLTDTYNKLVDELNIEYNKKLFNIDQQIIKTTKDFNNRVQSIVNEISLGLWNEKYQKKLEKQKFDLEKQKEKTINSLYEEYNSIKKEWDEKVQGLLTTANAIAAELDDKIEQNERSYQIFLSATSSERDRIDNEIERLESFKQKRYFIKPLLYPSNVYFEEDPLYGVKFILDKDIVSDLDNKFAEKQGYTQELETNKYILIPKGTVLWSQPIYVYQDNYPSTTLNKWNGKDIVTDNDTGIISARGFSAGKKEIDNTFTGVVLGDWSKTDSDAMLTQQTGVYGFNHGRMSYALKDDGTAFFGKDGKGRIYFNGNKAQIYSANWINSIPKENDLGKYIQAKRGMMLDIDDGQLLINGLDQQKIIIAENGVSFSCLSSYNDSQINLLKLEFNSPIFENSNSKQRPSFYLQSVDYHKAKKYSVTIDNQTKSHYVVPGKGIKFDLSEGEIDAYKLKLQVGQKLTYNNTQFLSYFLTINTDQNDFFKINNGAFIINKTGKVTCKKQFVVKSEIKGDDGWDKNKIKNNIRITENGALTTKDSITSWGNLIVKSNTKGGKKWDKNKIINNIRITKDGNLTTKKNLKCWGNLYLYFNGNNSGFKKGLHKIKLKNINGNMVLVASNEIY